jgi:hypothetical protein
MSQQHTLVFTLTLFLPLWKGSVLRSHAKPGTYKLHLPNNESSEWQCQDTKLTLGKALMTAMTHFIPVLRHLFPQSPEFYD